MNGKRIWLLSSTHYHQSPTNSSELFKSLSEKTLCQKQFRHGARWRHVLWHRGWTSSNGQWSLWRYCWWKKSCTSWQVVYPIIYKVLYIPGGAGFLPSTVCPIEKWMFFHCYLSLSGGFRGVKNYADYLYVFYVVYLFLAVEFFLR